MGNFAERLKVLRKEAGLTQEQLAEKIRVNRVTINRWEQADKLPADEYLLLLTEYFKVSTLYLLGIVDDRDAIEAEDEEDKQKKADEEYILTSYRLLSPDMKKLVRAMVNNALIIGRDREEM